MSNLRVLVTGGAGFIGSNLVRYLVEEKGIHVCNFDALTYAGNPASLEDLEGNPLYQFVRGDITHAEQVRSAIQSFQPGYILHLAAESHVDRSIDGPAAFLQTNVMGTFEMLQAAREYHAALSGADKDSFRFLHVSTDEVFGSLGAEGLFTETTPYQPNSPYSSSKAASDHLVRAWVHTYGLPAIITNCSNNYGPYQFPEKLIPVVILNALRGQPIPIYGKGDNVRDWLYVRDHAIAIWEAATRGEIGETYNVGGHNEKTNLEVVYTLCGHLDSLKPRASGSYQDLITFVKDRPGHDQRYAIDASKIGRELGWQPEETFESGMKKTVQWYLDNLCWCDRVMNGKYDLQRLGQA